MSSTEQDMIDRRRYKRLENVMPVHFKVAELQGDLLGIEKQMGFTSNVSRGGICLEVVHINHSIIEYLQKKELFLELKIFLPVPYRQVRAVGRVAWSCAKDEEGEGYMLGVEFETIKDADLKALMRQVRTMQFSTRLVVIFSILFFALLILIRAVIAP